MRSLLIVSQIGLWTLVLLLTAGFLILSRQIGLLHRRFGPAGARMEQEGLAVGERASDFTVADIAGRPVTLGSVRQKQTLLVFISPDCGACGGLMPAVRSIWKSERKRLEVVLVSLKSGEESNRRYIAEHRLELLPYLVSRQVAQEYRVASPPYAVLVGPDRIVQAKGLVNHLDHLESLLNAATLGQPTIERYVQTMTTPDSDQVPTQVAG
jgi:methylamine dehydrogenase accessory protein MauD